MKKLLAAALLGAFVTAAQAAPVTYAIDGSHTYSSFAINHFGFSTVVGRFDKTSGTVTLDAEKKTGAADITIDAASLNSGWPARDKHVKSADFLDVEKFPSITFKSDKFTFDGDKLSKVDGNLTIHGVTKPVTLTVGTFKCVDSHPMMKKPWCGADATATIKRSDFGVSAYVPNVGDELKLTIEIEAGKQ
ncbi:Polyisoprenoid-binding protein YceI [Andreprevotia lacus DSM 23236]|jgi:polyisoprenoid-binding protein YceI|uniref:Polyisoprenoid-binding protein YceI n=1 Tax=Andreprevotia lacus DSM 23236 TaxID=1121001 RepID=A0A1W1XS20_9NEIS|nr:YceI family protein [Andreprevotia lacus]SMC26318.1 Polyisoprenoid-binding protein YceI [Andreprevotia lacus DSM 23236]